MDNQLSVAEDGEGTEADSVRPLILLIIVNTLLTGCSFLYTAAEVADVLKAPTPQELCERNGDTWVSETYDPRTGRTISEGVCRRR